MRPHLVPPQLLILALALSAPLAAQRVMTLARGTKWETSALEIESGVDGPTVLLVGGIHGDQPASFRAARQVAGWSIVRGKLIVLDRANVLALAEDRRSTPGLPKDQADLNRQFPQEGVSEPRTTLAKAIWKLVERTEPDLLVALHEGTNIAKRDKKKRGSAIITDGTGATIAHAQAMLDAINESVGDDKRHFIQRPNAVPGSLVRAAFDELEIPSMLVETTTKGQSTPLRVRQLRILMHALLSRLRMIDDQDPHVMVGELRDKDDVTVALYTSSGVFGKGPDALERILNVEEDFVLRRVGSTDVQTGALDQFDVVIFPGGSGSGQGKGLRDDGRLAVSNFVKQGGGYVGICAGAYLAAQNYDWSLKILDADVVDRENWKRGKGRVDLRWASRAGRLLRQRGKGNIFYANGPLYAPAENDAVPDFEVLATFIDEIRNNDAPKGIMLNKPAIVRGTFGEGRVVCSSAHPEQTQGMDDTVRRLVRAAARER